MLLLGDVPTWVTNYPIPALIAGLVTLVVGADLLVRGAIWIALSSGMGPLTVGLTLVSIGTSLPELLVTLTAADGHAEMGIANVLGSNTANVLLIIGVAASIKAIRTKTRWLELTYVLLLSGLAAIPFVVGGRLDRWMGGVMVACLAMFLIQLIARERAAGSGLEQDQRPSPSASKWLINLFLVTAGFAMLKYGADWLVDGASLVATDFGMSEPVIGATVVAIGTSLPELATSLIAALRGQPELCIGNVIGSNIFNIGAVLGGAALLHPFEFEADGLLITTLVTAGVSCLVLTILLRKLGGVPRSVGLLFILAYASFTAYSVLVQPGG